MAILGISIGPGWSIGEGWAIGVAARPFLTTSSAQNYAADGATMNTFRVLNRGGNWDEFFANWTNGSWSCIEIPGSVVTNMTNPGDDSPIITITGGTFILNTFYTFQGHI
jgi:hypothetical protein